MFDTFAPMNNCENRQNVYDESSLDKSLEHETFIESPWTLIESYFGENHLKQLVRHQLESFDHFVNFQIQDTIDMFHPIHICSELDYNKTHNLYVLEMFISFEKFKIYRPQIHETNGATKLMFPQEARLRNFTYSSNMTIDVNIKYVVRNGENLENVQTFNRIIPSVHIGKLPIMLKSSLCVLFFDIFLTLIY